MPRKCESCHFFFGRRFNRPGELPFDQSSCVHIATPEPINEARAVCDREGDGHFVYFEPRDPEAGASVAPVPNVAEKASAKAA